MWAYTISDLEKAGWTKVTTKAALDDGMSGKYFVFVDAGSDYTSSMMVAHDANASSSLYYKKLAAPTGNEVWTLAANSSNYRIQAYNDECYINSGSAGWNRSVDATASTADYAFAVSSGVWSITSSSIASPNRMGPWDGTKASGSDYRVAINKQSKTESCSGDNAPGFYIYSIAKTSLVLDEMYDVTSKYLTNPSFETGNTTGWTVIGESTTEALTSGAYAKASADIATFNENGGVVADGDYVFKLQQWWSNRTAIYQTSSVTLPAGSYKLSANLQNIEAGNKVAGNYELGYIAGTVSNTNAPLTFTKSITGSFAEALKGEIIETDFTLAENTEVTFAAQSTVWGNHVFMADNFKLYRLEDVASKYITKADFSSATGWTNHSGGGGEHSEGFGLIGTLNLNGKQSTTDATHLATEYCCGLSARWNGRFTYYDQTVSLPSGSYTLSYDVEDVNTTSTKYNMDNYFYVQVGETKYSDTQTEWMNAGASGWTKHSISFVLNETSDVTISFGYGNKENKGTADCPAIYVSHLKLTYSPFADASDYAALNAAIDAARDNLGFLDGEYAPYNNAAMMATLAEAEAINQEANNPQKTVRGYISDLAASNWTENDGEVNAIYDGSFAHSYSQSGNVQPIGWFREKGTTDDGYNVRYVYSGAGLTATSSGKALGTKWEGYYGWQDGYTMPLNANTMYKLTFKYGTWGTGDNETRGDGYVQIKDGENNTITIDPGNSLAISTEDRGANTDPMKWKNFTGYFITTEAGNYVLALLKETTSQQNQYLYGDFSLVRATASEAKPYLLAEITNATGIYNSGANVGTGVFQITEEAGDDFVAAIATAQAVYDNGSATADDFMDAIDDLKAAEETFLTTLNAPDADKHYNIIVATTGHAKENNAVVETLGATSANNPTGYNFNASATPNANYAQAVKFTQVSGNTYNISFETSEGVVYLTYGSLNGSAAGWATQQIQGTTDSSKKGEFKIAATTTANVFNIVNTTSVGGTIACQAGGSLYTEAGNADFSLAEASLAEPNLTVVAGVNWATFMSPFAVNLDDLNGVEAYKITGVTEGVTVMTAVNDAIDANTPVLLYRQTTDSNYKPDLSGWGTAAANTYVEGLLTGSYEITYIPANSYALQKKNGKVGFYKVSEDNTIQVGANRAYLTVPDVVDGAREAIFFEEDVTGINTIGEKAANTLQDLLNGADVYDLSGRKVNGPLEKGKVYIVNGNKIYVN